MPVVNRNGVICLVQESFPEDPEKLLTADCRFVQCEVLVNDTAAKRWLIGHDFYFAERWLDVSVSMRTLPVDTRRKRYDICFGKESTAVLRQIYTEAYTEDRRFHLSHDYDQALANRVIEQYIQDALDQNMVLILCQYKGESIGSLFLQKSEKGFCVFLAGVRPRYQGTGAAVELYRAAADYCEAHGGAQLTGRISSANTGVMNLYGMLNASFFNPRDLYILDKGGC